MKTVTVFTDGDHSVTLDKAANGTFRVTYGMQIEDKLSYPVAAKLFGECVFHSLECAGKLDNDGDGE